MCGIAGFTHIQQPRPEPWIIHDALRSIRHRGPDQEGVYVSDNISLGAVRLKIIDLAGGDQPMHAGGTVVVFNGEIYNHRELRRELEQRGHSFTSHCDTEVVLHAFLEWDLECFSRLRGMFAVALWTEAERRLVLARDRMGIKPLYFWRPERPPQPEGLPHMGGHAGGLHFGSELKAIWAHPGVPRRISRDGLNRFFSFNYIPGEYTLAEDIRKLAPAHWLEWRNGSVRTGRYWSYRLDPRPFELEEAKSELASLLRASVREHLISDVPLGVWASGGLDSSTILHYAAEAVPQLKTFSVSFAGSGHDESRWFREVARRYGTDHHEFDLNADLEIRDTIEQMSYFSDEPSSDAGALPVWFLSRMCRSQVTVALSGEGADELFGGYNTYLADRYARTLRRVPRPLRRAAFAAARRLPASDEKIGFDYKLRRLLEGALLPAAEAHFFWNGTWSQDARRELLVDWRPLALPNGNGLWVDQHNYLPDDILYKTDRMSMAHSLEVRPAFLDHRIVEFAARLPDDLKIRGGTLKFVLRELMRDKLPRSVIARPKEGFDIPAHKWFRGVLKPLLLDCVNERSVRDTGLFHWPAVERAIGGHLARRGNYGYHLWGLLTFFLWKNRWNVATS